MKLILIFIVMDLLTLMAFPFVFVHSRLRQFSNPKEGIQPANGVAVSSITTGDDPSENGEPAKESE